LSAGVTLLVESVKKLFDPVEPNYSSVTLIVISVAIIVKLVLGYYVKNKGKELNSDALIASGSDALFDAIITLATLVSAAIMIVWGISLDGILSALISIVIIKAGVEMLSSPVNELLGTSIPAEFTSQIRKEVSSFEGVHGVYDLILHNYGPNVLIGSLHINVYDTMTAFEIHSLTRRITLHLYDKYGIIMTIGVYAIAEGRHDDADPETARRAKLQMAVMQALAAEPDILQVHGFYYSEKENILSVDVVPDISVHDESKLIERLTAIIQPMVPNMTTAVVVDHNYSE
jgi:divalent metal cation (Fe/Co/Zn/Cd) transporter